MSIPSWDQNNKVLPPIRPNTPLEKQLDPINRSPYAAPLEEVVKRFATTLDRVALFQNFLRYRSALHGWGITAGFQWINGSFVENVEGGSEPRSPEDIDVITFYYGAEDNTLHLQLLDPALTRVMYKVEGYGIELGAPLSVATAVLIGHLHSIWSHRRNGVWKGFVQVDLEPQDDPPALTRLQAIRKELEEA